MTIDQRAGLQRVLNEVAGERLQQHARFGEQNLPSGTGGKHWRRFLATARETCETRFAACDGSFLVLLAEEVAEAFVESDSAALRAELVQVAALTVQWIEALDRRKVVSVG